MGHISFRVKKDKAHIFHLVIDKHYRRLGLAKRLIAEVEKHCLKIAAKLSPLTFYKKTKKRLIFTKT